MRLSSAAAYKDAQTQLLNSLRQLNQAASSSAALEMAEQFFSLADFLQANPRVTRALVDSTKPLEARVKLFDRTDPLSQDGEVVKSPSSYLRDLLGRRIPEADDLIEICEELGLDAVTEEIKADHTSSTLEQTTDQLFNVSKILEEHPQLRNVLADRKGGPLEKRYQLLAELFGDQLSQAAFVLVKRAVATTANADRKRGQRRSLSSQLRYYQYRLAESQATQLATVRSAQPLTPAQQDRLIQILERRHQKKIHLNLVQDPNLIGGVQIQIGAEIYDGSVASALAVTKKEIAS